MIVPRCPAFLLYDCYDLVTQFLFDSHKIVEVAIRMPLVADNMLEPVSVYILLVSFVQFHLNSIFCYHTCRIIHTLHVLLAARYKISRNDENFTDLFLPLMGISFAELDNFSIVLCEFCGCFVLFYIKQFFLRSFAIYFLLDNAYGEFYS